MVLVLLTGCGGPTSSGPSTRSAPSQVVPGGAPRAAGEKALPWSHAYCSTLQSLSVAVGENDRVAVFGLIDGACDFGAVHLESKGAPFFATFDAHGSVIGARTFPTSESMHATIAAVPGGDWVVAGFFAGTLDLGAGVTKATNANDAFLARLDANGTPRWQKHFTGADSQQVDDVAVTPSGDIAIAGTYHDGALDLGKGPLRDGGAATVFVASFARDGALRWARALDGAKEQAVGSIAVDPAGDIALAGFAHGALDLGDGIVARDDRSPTICWVAKLDAAGRARWAHPFASIRNVHMIHQVAMGTDGSVAVAGFVAGPEGKVALGGAVLTSVGLGDAFVASLDPNGATRFFSLAGPPGGPDVEQHASDLVVTARGQVVVLGSRETRKEDDDGSRWDAYLETFDAHGAAPGPRLVSGATPGSGGHAIALDASGRLVVVGAFKGTLDLGMAALTPLPGSRDRSMFLAALPLP